ncbi:hypothetical protein BH23PLA1_BH23PLA1_23140 [soil metagenome]
MFAGPIIAREVLTAPRPLRHYAMRAAYAGGLLIVMVTAWQTLVGWSEGLTAGVLARFGAVLFSLFAYLQLTLMLFFAPLAAATAVAHEKDRRTFVLLLMTDLSDLEIVLGKLAASLLQILTLLAVSAPVFLLAMLLGGVSPGQVGDVFAVTLTAGIFGGALGMIVALWRDRTFQSLALTVLSVVLVLIVGQALSLYLADSVSWAQALGPYAAIGSAMRPLPDRVGLLSGSSLIYTGIYLVGAFGLLAASVVMLRRWNPGRNEPREEREEGEVVVNEESLYEISEAEIREPAPALAISGALGEDEAEPRPERSSGGGRPAGSLGLDGPGVGNGHPPSPLSPIPHHRDTTGLHVPRRTHRRVVRRFKPHRKPWDNPVLWRELRTRAYGTKPLIIKGCYVLAFALGTAVYFAGIGATSGPWEGAKAAIPPLLAILSLILINAQGVTSLTSERDTGALDLLLVTELTPKQFIYGKLYGVLYNTKEMLLLPIGLTVALTALGAINLESMFFIIVDFLLLAHFSAMLGLHAAITYTNSRQAVAHSLGTIFFLMLGILFCAYLIILSRQEFGRQLLSFIIFIGAGSVALYGSLGARNPSQAIGLVALLTPFWSFYCIISLLQGEFLAAFLFSVGVYGFAFLAMLVPAVGEFDIALGRTNALQG